MTTIVRSQRVVLPDSVKAASVHIEGGRIVKVGAWDDVPEGAPIDDVGNLYLLPGLVDTHVHINDPGRADWEGFETATRAAAAGGVTTLVDMPLNSIPSTTTPEAVALKVRALEAKSSVDVGLCGGLVPQNAAQADTLFREGILAFKCFLAESGVNEFSHVSDVELATGMARLATVGAPLFVHAELPGPLDEAEKRLGIVTPEDARRYATYLASRPKSAEDAAVDLVVRTAGARGARAHIVHLSSADALDILRRAMDARIDITAETCPHYLTLAAEEIPDGATAFKCAPPIRDAQNRDRLWAALGEGLIAQVVTDHSPSTLDLKCSGSGDFMKAWGGIASLEIGLSVVAQEGKKRGVPFASVVRWMSAAPAKLAGLAGKKGEIRVGCDADLAVWDEEATFTVDAMKLQHRNPITPYAARIIQGRVVRTMLRGETIFTRDERGEATFAARRGSWLRRT